MANIITHIELGDQSLVICKRCGCTLAPNDNFYVHCNALPAHSSGRLWGQVLEVHCAPCQVKVLEEAPR